MTGAVGELLGIVRLRWSRTGEWAAGRFVRGMTLAHPRSLCALIPQSLFPPSSAYLTNTAHAHILSLLHAQCPISSWLTTQSGQIVAVSELIQVQRY